MGLQQPGWEQTAHTHASVLSGGSLNGSSGSKVCTNVSFYLLSWRARAGSEHTWLQFLPELCKPEAVLAAFRSRSWPEVLVPSMVPVLLPVCLVTSRCTLSPWPHCLPYRVLWAPPGCFQLPHFVRRAPSCAGCRARAAGLVQYLEAGLACRSPWAQRC